MCRNKSVPDADDARIVVSDKGDILSPKYAPEIIAPAVQDDGMDNASPIPKSATPIVATVVQELPVTTLTIAHITQVLTRKNCGDIICMP